MKNLRIIIVDDNKTFRLSIKEIFQNKYKSWTIEDAGSEDELMKIKNFHMADLILMDIMMPGRNGIELSKNLLWNYRDLKIVANTMYIDNISLTTILGAGFKGCITKQDLLENFEECLNKVQQGIYYFPKYLNLKIF